MIIQPLVGRLSDQCTHFLGRRRPFAIVGAIISVFAMTVVGSALEIGTRLGDSGESHTNAVFVFVAGFWVLDISSNTLVIVFRSLIADWTPKKQLETAFSFQQMWYSVGMIAGFAAANVNWASAWWTSLFESPSCPYECASEGTACPSAYVSSCFDVRMAFLLCSVVTCCSVATSCLLCTELPLVSLEPSGLQESLLSKLCCNIKKASVASTEFRLIYLASLLSWMGWFACQMYQAHFVTVEVLGADLNEASRYQEDLHASALGLLGAAVLSWITGMVLPFFLSSSINPYTAWACSCLLLGVNCCISPILTWIWGGKADRNLFSWATALAWLASFGPMYAVALSVPYALIAEISRSNPSLSVGGLMGAINVAVCIPQLLLSLIGGPINSLFATDSASLLLGGLCAGLASLPLFKRAMHASEEIVYEKVDKQVDVTYFGAPTSLSPGEDE